MTISKEMKEALEKAEKRVTQKEWQFEGNSNKAVAQRKKSSK